MKKLEIIPILIVTILIVAGLILLLTNWQINLNNKPSQIPISLEGGHIKGNPEAKVVILEYSDFQCPYCNLFHQTMKQIMIEYGDRVKWVYKHFPLDNIHPFARQAAEVSECVWEQKGDEGFWKFADAAFENQDNLNLDFYLGVAQKLSLDMDKFKECIKSNRYKDKVWQHYREAIKYGIQGTPGGFINNEPLPGALPYESLKAKIDYYLSR